MRKKVRTQKEGRSSRKRGRIRKVEPGDWWGEVERQRREKVRREKWREGACEKREIER